MTPQGPVVILPDSGLSVQLGNPASADWGSAYIDGHKISIPTPANADGSYTVIGNDGDLVGNARWTITAGDKTILDDAQNANFFSREHQVYGMQESAATSTSPTMRALLEDTEYQNLVVGQGGQGNSRLMVSVYLAMSDRLKAIFQQTAIFEMMVHSGEINADGTVHATLANADTGFPGETNVTLHPNAPPNPVEVPIHIVTPPITSLPNGGGAAPSSAPSDVASDSPSGSTADKIATILGAAKSVLEDSKPIIDQVRNLANKGTTTKPTKTRLHGLMDSLTSLLQSLTHKGN